MATTIVMIGLDTFDVFKDGKRIARTTAKSLSDVDYDIAQTVAKAQAQPGVAVAVPNVAKVQRPRFSRPASNLIQ
jgi:hypothetical protein